MEHKKRDTESYDEWLFRLMHEYTTEIRGRERDMRNTAMDEEQTTRLLELYAALYAYELCLKTYIETEESKS